MHGFGRFIHKYGDDSSIFCTHQKGLKNTNLQKGVKMKLRHPLIDKSAIDFLSKIKATSIRQR